MAAPKKPDSMDSNNEVFAQNKDNDFVSIDELPVLRRELIPKKKDFTLSYPVVSPTGQWAAVFAGYSYDDNEIIVWDIENNQGFNLTENFKKRQTYARMSWSPDGKALAVPLKKVVESGHALWIFRLSPREEIFICDNWTELAWSPNGQHLAYVTSGRRLGIINQDGSNNKIITKANLYPIFDLTWADTNKVVFVSGWPGKEQQSWITPINGMGEMPLKSPIVDENQSKQRCFDGSFYHRPGCQILNNMPGGPAFKGRYVMRPPKMRIEKRFLTKKKEV